MLSEFIDINRLPESFADTVKSYYRPLVTQIVANATDSTNGAKAQPTPYFVGINGCQGSGKSTLVDYIALELAQSYKLNVVVMSLDDFYLSKAQRQVLANEIHPLLKTRGVPGTHDVAALTKVIKNLKSQHVDFQIPRFDKSQDEPMPMTHWPTVKSRTDVVLIEGWCWGIQSQPEYALKSAVNELEQDRDPNAVWRTYVNEQLLANYQPLYACIDYWLVLKAPAFDCVYQWRSEQENKLIDKVADPTQAALMSPAQIREFIQYFQRLTEYGLTTLDEIADVTLFLDKSRNVVDIQPKVSE